ncbi:MAG: redoxin domain-containing protein [Desulfuromonadales bacterium]|nr:redoxin domain-containing protein [Desulfuromonadales bacterium]
MRKQIKVGDKAPNFQFETPWRSSQGFYETAQDQDAVLVFLRYHGCPVCQMEMASFKREIALFKQKNAKVFVFLQSSTDTLEPLLKEGDWPFDIVCDPQGEIFELYAVGTGNLFQYLHPAALVAACKATVRGFMHKKFEGKETQLPAAFVIKSDKTVKYRYYGQNISDVPKPATLAANLD